MSNVLWVVAAIAISLHNYLFASFDSNFNGGIEYSLAYFIYLLLVVANRYKVISHAIKLPYYIVGVIIAIIFSPAMENDHYRYLWEAKVLLNQFSPYLTSPAELKDTVSFKFYDRIGFPWIPSVYPPLAHLWHAPFALLNFELGFKLLQIVNSLIAYKILSYMKVTSWVVVATFPFILKENISSAHLDFIAIFLLIFFMRKGYPFIGVLLSTGLKLLGIIPTVILTGSISSRRNPYLNIVLLFISSFIVSFTITQPGFKEFSQNWLWNPGIHQLISFVINESSTKIILACMVVVYVLMISSIRRACTQTKISMAFAFFIALSPVYNSWYAIWFSLPALAVGNNRVILPLVFSTFAYINFGHQDIRMIGQVLSHSTIWWYIIGEHLKLQKKQLDFSHPVKVFFAL
ncbi:MAG: hypothetical protein COW79_05765 [Bdellovibrionales bacterium CG22_combo_CG10-13_8_21_14_all_38_13]|nr:MAG: hypothetical protein COW79_05765 [Bdellovibrionales bacterium CG22_combo_CG10-13_8_21_14_all_38_13]